MICSNRAGVGADIDGHRPYISNSVVGFTLSNSNPDQFCRSHLDKYTFAYHFIQSIIVHGRDEVPTTQSFKIRHILTDNLLFQLDFLSKACNQLQLVYWIYELNFNCMNYTLNLCNTSSSPIRQFFYVTINFHKHQCSSNLYIMQTRMPVFRKKHWNPIIADTFPHLLIACKFDHLPSRPTLWS